MPEIVVGLGSNIEPESNLRWAIATLAEHFGPLVCSSVYRSPAFGFAGPEFLNMVVRFASALPADAVESTLSQLENSRGRDEWPRSGSRTLDLDLLLYGERVDAARCLPRADILAYPFVLAPLAEIDPERRHPVTGVAAQAAWSVMAPLHPELRQLGALDAA